MDPLSTTTGSRRRATMPADVLETQVCAQGVKASWRAAACSRGVSRPLARARPLLVSSRVPSRMLALTLALTLRSRGAQNEFVLLMDIPGVKQDDINLEIDGQVVRVRRVLLPGCGRRRCGLRRAFSACSADYKVTDEYSGDDIKWHRAGRPFGCVF